MLSGRRSPLHRAPSLDNTYTPKLCTVQTSHQTLAPFWRVRSLSADNRDTHPRNSLFSPAVQTSDVAGKVLSVVVLEGVTWQGRIQEMLNNSGRIVCFGKSPSMAVDGITEKCVSRLFSQPAGLRPAGRTRASALRELFYPSSFRNSACPSNPGNTVFKSLFPKYCDTTSPSTRRKSVVTARSRPSYNCDWSSPGQRP